MSSMTQQASADAPRRFRYDGKTYEVPAFNDISLKEIITFDAQAEALGISTRWDDIEELAQMSSAMTKAQAASHPLRYIMFATTIWFARRAAGEDITLEQATETKLSEIEWVPVPKDRQSGKKSAARKPAKKAAKKASSTRPGSVPDESPEE